MLMEEENVCASLPDITDSVLQQPLQDSWTPLEHQYINGEQQAIVWGETEVQINQAHETDQLSLSPKAGRATPEEAEQWEQIIWPVQPMTCTSPRLSFATVQWDMPDLSAETFPLMTDTSLANELNSGGVTSLGTTSPSLHERQEVNAELLTQEDGEEEDGFDSGLLNSDFEWTGSTFEPCDAANVQEPAAQEKEGSTHELLDSNDLPELLLKTDSDEERGHSANSDPVVVDLIDILEEIEGSECEVDNFVHIKREEEQEEPGVLLTGQEDSGEEQSVTNAFETEEEKEEGGEVEEEGTEEGDEDQTVSCPVDVEVPAEPLQTDNTVLTGNPDKLIDLQQSELLEERRFSGSEEDIEVLERLHEEPARQTEEPEMCTDVDQKVDPEQSEATDDDNEEPPVQTADRTENSQELLELTEKLEETTLDCDQTSSQEHSEHFEMTVEPVQIQAEVPEQLEMTVEPVQIQAEVPEQLEMTEEPVQIQAEVPEPEQLEMTEEPVQIQAEVSHQAEERHSEDQLGEPLGPQAEVTEVSTQSENADPPEESTPSEQTVCVEAEDPGVADQQEQTEPPEQNEQTADSSQPTLSEQLVLPEETDEPETTEQLSAETEVAQQTAEINQVDEQAETPHQAEDVTGSEDGSVQTAVANGEQTPETTSPLINGGGVEREMARRLAERLYKLDGIPRVDVVKHLDKDNDYSRAVGEEYLKFFDFTGQPLDHALRSFLKVVVLIGETQERERVLQHFSCRFQQCNPDSFSSSGSVLALTCALMLLNTDLHGQNVGKSMSSSKFVSNLDGMNEGENFNKDLLKSLYNSIKNEPLEWAVDEEELKNSVLVDEDAGDDAPLRSKANPFQDVPHDKTACVVKEGFLQRKLHADIDGKRTPWGKRSWKTFCGMLRGMVLYLQKDDYRKDQPTNEEVVSVHHSLAEQAAEYTKKPHVFRLQTADWRVFLFQASSKVEMNSWISRINLVSALHSSPPFPAAVGSQRRFFRPILPASQSVHTLERQLQSHRGMLESFKADLSYLQQNLPEGKKAKAKELEEHRVRAEYLQHEMCRYEIYIQVLEAWKSVKNTGDGMLSAAELNQFDKAVCADSMADDEEEGLKKSHSSPSLELELLPPTVIKVRRNISERRTYRRTIIPRWNKEA